MLVIPRVVHRLSLGASLCAACLLLFSIVGSRAAEKSPSILALDVWPVDDWRHNAVTSAAQTRDGYLWFGTYHGLIRYDGARFTAFNGGNAHGLCNGIITSLYLDRDGVLWIGHETGEVTRMANRTFASATAGKPLPTGPVEGFAEDEQNQLWLWNSTGQMFRLADGKALQIGIQEPMRKGAVAAGLMARSGWRPTSASTDSPRGH